MLPCPKKPNWVTAEWCWQLRVENTVGYFIIISWYFDKIFHCVLNSQPSAPFSCDSIWLLWNPNKRGLFFEKICFSAMKHLLKQFWCTVRSNHPVVHWSWLWFDLIQTCRIVILNEILIDSSSETF